MGTVGKFEPRGGHWALAWLCLAVLFVITTPACAEEKKDELPDCKLVTGMTKDKGSEKFEAEIEQRFKDGYRIVGFSTVKHEKDGFYLQALMIKEVPTRRPKAATPAKGEDASGGKRPPPPAEGPVPKSSLKTDAAAPAPAEATKK
jgi:hypothetical protein